MHDPRLKKMASVIVHYSLEVKPQDLVWLTGDLAGLPLIEALYEEIIKAGAILKPFLQPPGWDEIFFKYASDTQLSTTCPFALYAIQTCNKRIRILAPSNTRSLAHVDSKKQAMMSKANQPIMSTSLKRAAANELNWMVTLCPTFSGAQEADMGFHEYCEFVFEAAGLNEKDPVAYLKEMEIKQQKLIEYLSTKRELHFKTPHGTDLLVNVENMVWINSCGKRNYPDGEVFTGPNLNASDGGVNGVIKYTFPALWQNTIVEDIELTFERGKVVDAKAKKNESFLRTIIAQDEGSKRFGEIAIGTNYKIQKFTQNILFDEKIGGTFHAALGAGYPETKNTNQSALHWDMICDLRAGGVISADGELFSKNGEFVHVDFKME